MTEIKDGERYRVTFEGVGRDKGVRIPDTDTHLYPRTLRAALKVELIEPAYTKGELYRDFSGDTFRYNGDGQGWALIYRAPNSVNRDLIGRNVCYDVPQRPLRKLVPESR